MTTASEIVDSPVDWDGLVARALGIADLEPEPRPLLMALRRWQAAFDMVEHGWPVEADFPEAVREFFRKLTSVSPKGRPGRGEGQLRKARKAWETAVLRDEYDLARGVAKLAKATGGNFEGEKVYLEDRPSAKARSRLARLADAKENTIDAIVNPRRKK